MTSCPVNFSSVIDLKAGPAVEAIWDDIIRARSHDLDVSELMHTRRRQIQDVSTLLVFVLTPVSPLDCLERFAQLRSLFS
jgi:hypothetical protein